MGNSRGGASCVVDVHIVDPRILVSSLDHQGNLAFQKPWYQRSASASGSDNDAIQQLFARYPSVELSFLFLRVKEKKRKRVVVEITALRNALDQTGEKGIVY